MNTLILSLLLACGGADVHHDHVHEGDHDGDHAHEHEGDPAHKGEPAANDGAIEGPLGTYTARLEPSGDTLKLVVVDGEGKPVPAQGEARVMLTGTGEQAQRVVLTANGEAWTGAAKAEGAPGYLAVVSVTVGGHQESARLSWGSVPEAAPAPAPHDHDDGGHEHGGEDHQH
jgi:hypothetical protein